MAKTKRSKKRSKKTRSKSSRSNRIDASLLLAVLDELNELAGLLRCVPELNILSDSFRDREFWGREMEENDAGEGSDQIDCDHDRIATAAMEHFGRNIDVIDQEERDKNAIDYDARFGIDPPMYASELVGVPEAVIDAVRWRLQRLRAVLEMVH